MFSSLLQTAFPITIAHATPMPTVPCPPSLPRCGVAGNVLATSVAPVIVQFIVSLAVALSLVFVLWAGLSMVLAIGDEGKATKAKDRIIYALGGVAIALSSQSIYSFFIQDYTGLGGFNDVIFGGVFPTIASGIVTVFDALFILSTIIAGIRMVLARGKEDEFSKGRSMLIWSIAGAIVINVAYTLVKTVVDIFSL